MTAHQTPASGTAHAAPSQPADPRAGEVTSGGVPEVTSQTPAGPVAVGGAGPAGPPSFTVVVLGLPAPQGSKKHVGRGVMVESSKKVKPWREAVKTAAADLIHVAGDSGRLTAGFPLDGPLLVEFCFTLPRPASAPKRRRHPDRIPDLSKLIRSTEDALTEAGAWADDARIVAYHQARKTYPHPHSPDPDALSVPGAVIRIWEINA